MLVHAFGWQILLELEDTLPSERNPKGSFVPVHLAAELKIQVWAVSFKRYGYLMPCRLLLEMASERVRQQLQKDGESDQLKPKGEMCAEEMGVVLITSTLFWDNDGQ